MAGDLGGHRLGGRAGCFAAITAYFTYASESARSGGLATPTAMGALIPAFGLPEMLVLAAALTAVGGAWLGTASRP